MVVYSTTPNNPPAITSTPAFVATANVAYQYQLVATDPDGDVLTYQLLAGPAGMSIDPTTGLVAWTPASGQLGIHAVQLAAIDPFGAGATQSFSLNVRAANRAPVVEPIPDRQISAGAAHRYDVRATDADGDRLAYALLSAPAGMTVDALGRIRWSPAATDIGMHPIEVSVSDPLGASATRSYELTVSADTLAPQVVISVSRDPALAGEDITLVVLATDDVGVSSRTLSIDGVPVVLDSGNRATVRRDAASMLNLLATAEDPSGNVGQASMALQVIDPRVTGDPVVAIASPTEEIPVTAPVDIIGTADDPDLLYYTLEVAPFGSEVYTEFVRGTTPVVNGVLGQFDPSVLANDSYVLRLTAYDTGGNDATIESLIAVAGEVKLGNFTLSFTDLSVAVSGIPITVTRTYDSFDALRTDELGYGWRLAFRDTDLRTNVPQTGSEEDLIYNPFRNGTRVYVNAAGRQAGRIHVPARACSGSERIVPRGLLPRVCARCGSHEPAVRAPLRPVRHQ